MINYTEKYGLQDAIKAAGYMLIQIDNAWVTSTPVEVQSIIDSHNGAAALIAVKTTLIKLIAKDLILNTAPTWKQRNMLALNLELLDIAQTRSLTADEQAAKAASKIAWGLIQEVRANSRAHELNVSALTTESEINAYDINIGW